MTGLNRWPEDCLKKAPIEFFDFRSHDHVAGH